MITKVDLNSNAEGERQAVVDIAAGAPVVMLSALTGEGLDALDRWLKPGATAALLGSSGAGKSTLLNALAGEELMSTGAVREAVLSLGSHGLLDVRETDDGLEARLPR